MYRFLKSPKCGACAESNRMLNVECMCVKFITFLRLRLSLDDTTLTRNLLERSVEHHESASQHRLNQPSSRPMNPALQAAHKAKEAIAAVKMQAKGNIFTVEMALSIFPSNGTAPKKVKLIILI